MFADSIFFAAVCYARVLRSTRYSGMGARENEVQISGFGLSILPNQLNIVGKALVQSAYICKQ